MKSKYSASLNPFSVGTGIFLCFFIWLIAGVLSLYFYPPISKYGTIWFLFIIVVLVLIPIIRNKRKSIFEQNRIVLYKYDGLERQMYFFRLIVYEDGIEIRAFYNTYFIPFDEIKDIRTEAKYFTLVRFGKGLTIETGIEGLPDYIEALQNVDEFSKIAELIIKKYNERKNLKTA
jgi:hypothetical protein